MFSFFQVAAFKVVSSPGSVVTCLFLSFNIGIQLVLHIYVQSKCLPFCTSACLNFEPAKNILKICDIGLK
jgi:hypothetical protein